MAVILLLALGGAALYLGTHSTSSPAARATATPHPSSSATATVTGTASASSAGGRAVTMELTVDQIPAGGPTLSQIDDGLLNNTPNTDGRVFANTDRTFVIELDVLVDTGAQTAAGDYAAVRDAAKGRVATITKQTSPQLGQQADEYIGTTSRGQSIFAIAFRDGYVLAGAFVVMAGATVDQNYAESLALAADQKIAANL